MKTNIQTLATRDKSTKLKKHEAAAMIEQLYEDRNSVNDYDLARLYKFFMPALPKIAKTDFQWLAKAISKEETRPHLNYIYCDGEHAIATDGCRMHWLLCNIPVGFYDSNQNKIDVDLTFPDWKRIMVTHEHSGTLDIEACELGKTGYSGIIAYTIKNILFNKTYIDDALNGANKAEITYSTNDGSLQHMKFTMGNRNAVVMNIRN